MALPLIVEACRKERRFPAVEIVRKISEIDEARELFGEQFINDVQRSRTRTSARTTFCEYWLKLHDITTLVFVKLAVKSLGNSFARDFLAAEIEKALQKSDCQRAERAEIEQLFKRYQADDVGLIGDDNNYRIDTFVEERLITFGIPVEAKKYHGRSKTEDSLFVAIKEACREPEKGMLVITGGKGIGKSTMMAHLLSNETRQKQLINEGNVQIAFWIDCSYWRTKDQWTESALPDRIFQIGKSAKAGKDWPIFTGLSSVVDYFKSINKRLLFVLDRIENSEVLDFVCKQNVQAAFCILTRDIAPLRCSCEKVNHAFVEYSIAALDDDDLVEMLGTTLGLNAILNRDQLTQLAKICNGLPYYAGLVAKQFYDNPTRVANTFNVMTSDPRFMERLNTAAQQQQQP